MLERDGYFEWPQLDLVDGIRQDVSEGVRRYRVLRNLNWRRIGAITKDLGIKKIHETILGDATDDVVAGVHALYTSGTHKLIVFLQDTGKVEPYDYDASNNTFSVDTSRDFATGVRPFPIMFADKLYVFDGNSLGARDSAGTWTTPGGTEANGCTMATVYAGRLIGAGYASAPFTFYPSGVRDGTTWDNSISQNVVGTIDEISCLGTCGAFMIVGGRTFTRAYYLGTASPDDWDVDTLSDRLGPVNHTSFVEVALAKGASAQGFSFFWSQEGPMMLMQQGQGVPSLHPLWEPLQQFVAGLTYEGLVAIDLAQLTDIQGVWVPEYREVRWTVRSRSQIGVSNARNDLLVCLHVDSAIQYALGNREYPLFRIRDNTTSKLPCSTIFTARMDPRLNDPDDDYPVRCLIAENGFVYEMDAKSTYNDDGTGIPFELYMDGFTGQEDGIRGRAKSVRAIRLTTGRPGNYTLTVDLFAEGARVDQVPVSLSGGGYQWDATTVHTWNGGKWSSRSQYGESIAGVHAVGQAFAVRVIDEGTVLNDFHLMGITPTGYVEEQVK